MLPRSRSLGPLFVALNYLASRVSSFVTLEIPGMFRDASRTGLTHATVTTVEAQIERQLREKYPETSDIAFSGSSTIDADGVPLFYKASGSES